MFPEFIPFLLLLALTIALLAAWILAELRALSPSRRIGFGIATLVSAVTFTAAVWQADVAGKQFYDHRSFCLTLLSLQEALHQNKSAEVEHLLVDFQPMTPSNYKYQAISGLRAKLALLSERPSDATPAPTGL